MNWIEALPPFVPADVRTALAPYASQWIAWEQCQDGALLLWLARSHASEDPRRLFDLRSLANETAVEIDRRMDAYWAGRPVRPMADPWLIASDEATRRLHAAANQAVREREDDARDDVAEDERGIFDVKLEEFLRMAAETVRKKLGATLPW